MLFQLVSRRYHNKSTLITTNRAFPENGTKSFRTPPASSRWSKPSSAQRAEIVAIEGDSYRLKEARDRAPMPGHASAAWHQVMSTMPDHLRPDYGRNPRHLDSRAGACRLRDAQRTCSEKIWARYSCQQLPTHLAGRAGARDAQASNDVVDTGILGPSTSNHPIVQRLNNRPQRPSLLLFDQGRPSRPVPTYACQRWLRAAAVQDARGAPPKAARSVLDGCEHDGSSSSQRRTTIPPPIATGFHGQIQDAPLERGFAAANKGMMHNSPPCVRDPHEMAMPTSKQ